jgi:hypothetical protein
MTQTLLAVNRQGKLHEFPVQERGTLGAGAELFGTAAGLLGAYHRVYGYILNRNPRYKHPYYGWALPR